MGELISLIRLWLAYRALSDPAVLTIAVIIYLVLLFTCSIFFAFKNGIISLVSYLTLVVFGTMTLFLIPAGPLSYTDDLKLRAEKEVIVRDITSEGLVIRSGFLTKAVPLLGVRFTNENSDLFASVKEAIRAAEVNGKLTVQYSDNYIGVLVLTSSKTVLNEAFLKQGLALASSPAPCQYVKYQESARDLELGVWKNIKSLNVEDASDPARDAVGIHLFLMPLCALYSILITLALWIRFGGPNR